MLSRIVGAMAAREKPKITDFLEFYDKGSLEVLETVLKKKLKVMVAESRS